LLLLLSFNSFGQESEEYKNSIGIDAIGGFAAMLGSYNKYDPFELSYIRKGDHLDFRAKFNMNNRNFIQDKILQNRYLDPEKILNFKSDFRSKISLQISTGIAKRVKNNILNYYYGFDVFAGINAGKSTSRINDESDIFGGQYIGDFSSSSYKVGLIPVIGTKIPLFKRLSFELEFGLPLHYDFGSITYYDETRMLKDVSVKGWEFGFDRFLNDLRFSYNF